MHARTPSITLEELQRQQLTKLVLIYDRQCVTPLKVWETWGTSGCGAESSIILKATEMPSYAFAYTNGKIAAKYSFKPLRKSGKTYTIVFTAHHEMISTILRKAFALDGPKFYNFFLMQRKNFRWDEGMMDSNCKNFYFRCSLSMDPPKVGRWTRLGKDGKMEFYTYYSNIEVRENRLNHLRRVKARYRMMRNAGELIIPG